MIKNPPAMRETWLRSLDWEDALEEGLATHSSILAWRIPGTEEPGGLLSMGWHRDEPVWLWGHPAMLALSWRPGNLLGPPHHDLPTLWPHSHPCAMLSRSVMSNSL